MLAAWGKIALNQDHQVIRIKKEAAVSETIEELTVNYEEDGIVTTEEMDKKVLSKGAWTTIIYRFHVWDFKAQEYGPDKYTIRRYQKRNGVYQQRSRFNISSADQATKIIAALQEWVGSGEGEAEAEAEAK